MKQKKFLRFNPNDVTATGLRLTPPPWGAEIHTHSLSVSDSVRNSVFSTCVSTFQGRIDHYGICNVILHVWFRFFELLLCLYSGRTGDKREWDIISCTTLDYDTRSTRAVRGKQSSEVKYCTTTTMSLKTLKPSMELSGSTELDGNLLFVHC